MERNTRINVRPGMFYKTVMPYSEVCMHMRIAGKEMIGKLSETGSSVQLFTPDPESLTTLALAGSKTYQQSRMFSAPILPGEAGLYQDSQGFYFYVEVKQ